MNLREHRLIGIGFAEGIERSRAGAELELFSRTLSHNIGRPGNDTVDDVLQGGANAGKATINGILGAFNAAIGTITGQRARVTQTKGLIDSTESAVVGGFKRMGTFTPGGVVGGAYQVVADGSDGAIRDLLGTPYKIETV